MSDASLLPFFSPRGVVVIGASASPEKLGHGVARNLIQSGYRGAINFVSQKQGELFGRPLYTEVSQVPDPTDLAIIIVPPGATPESIDECGRGGIKAAIIVSAGFRETDAAGAALENKCVEIARSHRMRLLGPNCIGVIDTHLPLDTTFLQPPMTARGHIGFISHSGAFCAAVVDWARGEGFGFSRIVSLGNQADVNETDVLAALAEHEHTRVIVLYMESASDGRRFVEVASEVTRRKPVVALKVGRFESGRRAAASHTGALAASDTAFEAAFEKAGILRADSAEQMLDWARALAACPLPAKSGSKADRDKQGFAVLTNAGGPGVIAADAIEKDGLSLATLHESTTRALIASLPPAASVFNPVDMLASASPEIYAACLKILLDDDNVAGALVILPPPPMFRAEDVAEKMVAIGGRRDKPVIVALMGSKLVGEAGSIFREAKVPTYPFPERAASALGALAKRVQLLSSNRNHEFRPLPTSQLTGATSRSPEELLEAYNIDTAPLKLAHSIEEATSIAEQFGYPVVMKIASPDIPHKSDVSGVVLDIANGGSLHLAYTQIMTSVKAAAPAARIDGVHIQRQIPPGQDVILGAVRDPQFGPLMMFGSGGVEVEQLGDVAFALAPLSEAEALIMIRRTWAGRRLQGFRDIPPADEAAVVDALIGLSRLVIQNETIEEIEINPLRALSQGVIAIDVRIKQTL